MAYHVYTTDGWILKGSPTGEADKYFHILTKDLGLVIARARSARLGVSKLAPSLVDFSLSTLSFVKGKYSWRLVGAKSLKNSYRNFKTEPTKRLLWVRFLNTLRQLIHGEEKDTIPFKIAETLYETLIAKDYSESELKSLECLALVYLLKNLGYIEEKEYYKDIVSSDFFHPTSLQKVELMKKEIISDLNAALSASSS